MKKKDVFATIYESMMGASNPDAFDPAMGDSIYKHLVLTALANCLKEEFPEAEIAMEEDTPEMKFILTFQDGVEVELIIDEDSGSIIVYCEESQFDEELDFDSVLDLLSDRLYSQIRRACRLTKF